MDLKAGFDTETRDLHQMSKQWLALREDLVTFHAQLGFLRDAHKSLMCLEFEDTDRNSAGIHEPYNPFDVLVSQAEICARWTTVYRGRTDICIQMVRPPQPIPILSPPQLTTAALPPLQPTHRALKPPNSAANSTRLGVDDHARRCHDVVLTRHFHLSNFEHDGV
jgi:hypothetical protein